VLRSNERGSFRVYRGMRNHNFVLHSHSLTQLCSILHMAYQTTEWHMAYQTTE